MQGCEGHPLAGRPPETYSLQYVEEADRGGTRLRVAQQARPDPLPE